MLFAARGLLVAVVLVGGCGVSQELYDVRTTELDRCREDLTRAQADLNGARSRLDEAGRSLDRVSDDKAKCEADKRELGHGASEPEIDELRRTRVLAAQRGELLRSLQDRLAPLIVAHAVEVAVRRGHMYARLSDQTLFDPTGALSSGGQAALRQVAAALREVPDRDFLVVGHTDNQPARGRSNWELSTAHAILVVRFVQGEGVDPRRLAAAGASEFDALAPNETPEQRALNRRVEIVILPMVNELPAITPPAAPAASAPTPPTPATRPSPAPQTW